MVIVNDAKRQEREKYVARKVFDEARAYDEFFRGAYNNAQSDLGLHASQLVQNYELTRNQSTRLIRTAKRAHRAREIISYLGERFGISDSGEILDAQGLYKVVFGRKAPVSVRAYNRGIALEFELDNWRYPDAWGLAGTGVNCDPLRVPLEVTKKKIDAAKTIDLGQLVILLPSIAKISRMLRSRKWRTDGEVIIEQMFGPQRRTKEFYDYAAKEQQTSTRKHELKHIHDNIIGSDIYPHQETSAHLYQGRSIRYNLGFTKKCILEELKDRADRTLERIEFYRKLNCPDCVIETYSKVLANIEKETKAVFEHFSDLDSKCTNIWDAQKVSGEILSYVFSVSPNSRIVRRIDCINKLVI